MAVQAYMSTQLASRFMLYYYNHCLPDLYTQQSCNTKLHCSCIVLGSSHDISGIVQDEQYEIATWCLLKVSIGIKNTAVSDSLSPVV